MDGVGLMHHYNHDDKLIISMPDSLSILQSLHNANVADLFRVLFLSGGFVGDAFKPSIGTSTSVGASGECTIVMPSGDVIFANGEVFHGDGTQVSISVPRSAEAQLIVLDYQPLRHVQLDKASGYGGDAVVYGYRRDGARISLSSQFARLFGVNELLIAEVRNPLDGTSPVLVDRRISARHYRSTSIFDSRQVDASSAVTAFHGLVPSEANAGNQYRSAIHDDDMPGIRLSFVPEIAGNFFEYLLLLRPRNANGDRMSAHWRPRGSYAFASAIAGERMKCASVLQDRNDGSIATDARSVGDFIVGNDSSATTPPTTTLDIVADNATKSLLISATVTAASLPTEDTCHRSFLQLWARDGGISHYVDPLIMPPQIERDVVTDTTPAGYYPRSRYVPMGSSRLSIFGARAVLPGQICGSMAAHSMTRSGVTWLYVNLGPDFSYRDPSYMWYSPQLGAPGTDTWWTYNSYPTGGTANYGRQSWWNDSLVGSIKAPGAGWTITQIEFINWYVDTIVDAFSLKCYKNGVAYTPATLACGYATALNNPYSKSWVATSIDGGIALAEDDEISFQASSAGADPLFVTGCIRVCLTKESS